MAVFETCANVVRVNAGLTKWMAQKSLAATGLASAHTLKYGVLYPAEMAHRQLLRRTRLGDHLSQNHKSHVRAGIGNEIRERADESEIALLGALSLLKLEIVKKPEDLHRFERIHEAVIDAMKAEVIHPDDPLVPGSLPTPDDVSSLTETVTYTNLSPVTRR